MDPYAGQHRPPSPLRTDAHGAAQPERQHGRKEAGKAMIAQKRDVSYVQLALSLKRAQIQRLEAYAARRAATLQQAEEAFEQDALEFDDFLRRNDEEVQEAVRQANEQARIRQDKVHASEGFQAARRQLFLPHV